MPLNKYVKLTIGDKAATFKSAEELPIGISYQLEDTEDFQRKTSSSSLNVKIPASPENDLLGNSFHNPAIEDLTAGEIFRSSQKAIIEANGIELLVGKAFLNSATHTDKPEEYDFSFFGNNADWVIDLKEATLYEFLKHISFTFSKVNIVSSWGFDGTTPALPYVFAPVRYGKPMGGYKIVNGEKEPDDRNMKPEYMKPAISKYWLAYWGFKSLGYRLQSTFFDSTYFRRQVMPWTWGNFLSSEGTKYDVHRFNAIGTDYYTEGDQDRFLPLNVSNDSTDGGFDNNVAPATPLGDYVWDAVNNEAKWTYNTPHYGILEATFSTQVFVDAFANQNSEIWLHVYWYKNGVQVQTDTLVNLNTQAGIATGRHDTGIKEAFFTATVSPGDVISAKYKCVITESKLGDTDFALKVLSLQLDYFKIPLGGTINFDSYYGFKKYKFLEFLKGLTDEFNLTWQTDPVTKTVVVEPTHPYSLTDNIGTKQGGYFHGDFISWEDKQDLSKISEIELYKEFEREVTLKHKEDSNDGPLKVVQDRHQIKLAAGKYVFPERFKAGKKEVENRFFSTVVHYDVAQWAGVTGTAPQMVVLAPENVSNTSASEAENTFAPKSCYYKGLISGLGWIFDGEEKTQFPFMFAVNYMPGGEHDPVLSYCDENINGKLGKGLLKRFYWQRFAIMRNGQWYNTWMKLNNYDVQNWFHREFKVLRGQRWELVKIENYRPLLEETTKVLLRKWAPITQKDFEATFPTQQSVLTGAVQPGFDGKYNPLKCLSTDIPT